MLPYRKHSFGIVAARTKDKLFDENIKHLLQFPSFVRTVDNKAVSFDIELGLGTKFTAKKLGRI
jgi:hypothetical protein